ncbi:cell adhesion molecule Dscam1-like isoform X2 [Tachypleus tridentatus]
MKDGRILSLLPKRFISSSKSVLEIPNVEKKDQGMYQCFVQNLYESVQASSELSLGDMLPELTEHFFPKLLRPGLPMSLKCIAKGTPKPQISWYLDETPVVRTGRVIVGDFVNTDEEVVSYVNISSVQVEDGGHYKCAAGNGAGTAAHIEKVDVYGLPFVRPFRNITVVAKKTMRIHCYVAGYPIDSIHWEKDSRRLPFNHRQKVHNNGTLQIISLDDKEDEGIYSCVARNNRSQSARADFYATVKVPPLIGEFHFDKNLHEGMRTRVYCSIAQGDQPITISWLKDGLPIPHDLGISVRAVDSFSVALAIDKLEPVHNGNYTCVAANDGATVQHTAQLVVDVPPYWMIEPTNTYVVLNEPVNIDCLAKGYPVPQITWKRAKSGSGTDFEQILSGPDFQVFENGTLRLAHTKLQDRGHYLCQANNGVGSGLSKVVHVTVHVPAHFEMNEKTITVNKGKETKLLCEAIGDKPMAIIWNQNNHPLNPLSKKRYALNEKLTKVGMESEVTIFESQRSDTGSFVCLVTNAFGQDEIRLQLIVQESPSPPQDVRLLEVRSRSVTIEWSTPYDGNSFLRSYVIMFKNLSESWHGQIPNLTVKATEEKVTIRDLHPSFTYNFRVLAQNALGNSEPSVILNVTTEEEVPGGPPTSVAAEALDASSIKVLWKPPLKILQNGRIKGYYIGYRVHNSTDLYHYKNLEGSREECVLSNLQKFTGYSVLVQAYNSMGAGPRSDEILVLTKEDVPDKPPTRVICSALTSQSLHVEWTPPSPKSINGILQGFHVTYRPVFRSKSDAESRRVGNENLTTNLAGLEIFTNYSVQVAACSRVGDGVFSDPVYCRTLEGVPGEPANIKVSIMAQNAILVSWKPPLKPNGDITKYTAYKRTKIKGKQNVSKAVLPANQLTFEARDLVLGEHYEFWVTASTSVGEGATTPVIVQTPDRRAPARIASFGDQITIQQQQDIELPCRAVGLPTPFREWRYRGQLVNKTNRLEVFPTGTLRIESVRFEDSGNYSCSVWNIYGSDEIIYLVNVEVKQKSPFPPLPPMPYIDSTTSDSVIVAWRNRSVRENPIIGYTLYYKKKGDWSHVNIPGNRTRFTISGLNCGSHYEVYMISFNKIGESEAGDIVSAHTKGGEPVPPKREVFITPNTTSLTLHLNKWDDGGCPILKMSVKYKMQLSSEWTVIATRLKPEEGAMTLHDLRPDTWYNIQITAHNSAGKAIAEYSVLTSTYSVYGATLIPELIINTEEPPAFYEDAAVIVPVVTSLVVIVSVVVLALVVCQRKHSPGAKYQGQPVKNDITSDASLINSAEKKLNSDHNNQLSSCITHPYKMVPSETQMTCLSPGEDISPYATFHTETRYDSQPEENPKPSRNKGSRGILHKLPQFPKTSNAWTPDVPHSGRYATTQELQLAVQQQHVRKCDNNRREQEVPWRNFSASSECSVHHQSGFETLSKYDRPDIRKNLDGQNLVVSVSHKLPARLEIEQDHRTKSLSSKIHQGQLVSKKPVHTNGDGGFRGTGEECTYTFEPDSP